MNIGKLLGDKQQPVSVRDREVNDAVKRHQQDNVEKTLGKKGEDRITISPLARQLATVTKVLNEDETARTDRVASLKAQVANGSYNVSSGDVAKAIISFAGDLEPLKERD